MRSSPRRSQRYGVGSVAPRWAPGTAASSSRQPDPQLPWQRAHAPRAPEQDTHPSPAVSLTAGDECREAGCSGHLGDRVPVPPLSIHWSVTTTVLPVGRKPQPQPGAEGTLVSEWCDGSGSGPRIPASQFCLPLPNYVISPFPALIFLICQMGLIVPFTSLNGCWDYKDYLI